jgi:hypothetical protein
MSDRRERDRKKSKSRRKDHDDDDVVRGSGVNYSKVTDRHVDDDRYEKHRNSSTEAAMSNEPTDASKNEAKVSAQMAAVMRVMAGQGERTIAEKLADSNRPTWEQYKKDNEDKLNIAGLDQKKMEEYRKQLDEQREKLLTRGTNHRKDDEGDKKSKKKRKKKHRRRDDSYSDDSSSSDESHSSDSGRKHKKKKHRKRKKRSRHHRDDDSYSSDSRDDRKRSSKHRKKKDKQKKRSDDGSGSGDSYRLSSFFTKGSDEESK